MNLRESFKRSTPPPSPLNFDTIEPNNYLGVLIWNFYRTLFIVCFEMWLRFDTQIRSTRFAMNILFMITTTEMKFCFCVKLFNHFLTEYSSVWGEIYRVSFQILLGFFIRFQQEIIIGKWSRNILHFKALHFPDLQNFALVFTILFWVHIMLKCYDKTSRCTFICCLYPVKETRPKKKTQKKI